MKLQNSTKIPDGVLKKIISKASNGTKANIKNTWVEISFSKIRRTEAYGYAVDGTWLLNRKNNHHAKYLIHVIIPNPNLIGDKEYIEVCQNVFNVFAHEWTHISDFQHGVKYERAEYNKNWKNRSWEIRAVKTSNKCFKHMSIPSQNIVIDLAIEYERIHNERLPQSK